MKDGIVRKIIKRIALVGYTIDLQGTRAIQRRNGEPFYKLCGSCNNCGGGCKSPMIQVFPLFYYLRSYRWIIKMWHKLINGFEYIGEDRRNKTFTFRCTHWDPETKLCDSYDSRPGMCRDYPRPLLYSYRPEFLKECSFYAVDKNAGRMVDALKELDLPEEKLNDIKDKLHLHQ